MKALLIGTPSFPFFNADMGKDSVIGRNFLSDLNGVLLLDFCGSQSLSITNTMFKQRVSIKARGIRTLLAID